MKRTTWYFLALALAGSANCRVNSDGLALVSGPGAGSDGELETGGTTDSGSPLAGTGGQDTDSSMNLGGATGSGGTRSSGGATDSGDVAARGGAAGSGGGGSGGIVAVDGATVMGGVSSTGGGTGLGGTAASGGASGAGGSPNPDGEIDRPNLSNNDAPPEALAETGRDIPVDKRTMDAPAGPGDALDGASTVGVDGGPSMTLVWSDDFNGSANTGVDVTKWSYVTWDPGHVNNEAQKYTNRLANVFQDGRGHLVIRGLSTQSAANPYTSGRIESNGHFTFQYGRVEVSAKLPSGLGSFPGIIAMGTTGTWPKCGELALMEQYGQDKSWFYVSATAGSADDTGNVKYTFPDATISTSSDFHVYSVDWYSDRVVFQVDGNEIARTTFTASSPFANIPEYLVLDLALGGNMGGTIDPDAFPMDMIVDYVRVYSF